MKAKPCKINPDSPGYIGCQVSEATHLALNMPGPTGMLVLPVITKGSRDKSGCWSWNGDVDKPTIRPSILTVFPNKFRCHSFVNDGFVQFLLDSSHIFAGSTIELLDIEPL